MFKILKNLIKGKKNPVKKDKNKIKKEVDLKTAAAVIMVNLAYADDDFSEEEQKYISGILKKDFDLSEEDVEKIIEEAQDIIEEDTNKWRYINSINRSYSNKEKEELIKKLWELIYRDEKLHGYEDKLIHSITNMLHIPHKKMIDIKVEVIEDNN